MHGGVRRIPSVWTTPLARKMRPRGNLLMSELPIHSDVLPDRIWRCRHPLRKRVGRLRKFSTLLLMLFLWSIILGYVYLTNEYRVRGMAADYLGNLLGGQ